jgi:predicted restriction endonuclease
LVDPTKSFLLELPEIADIVPLALINAQASGNKVSDDIAEQLDHRLAAWIADALPPLGIDQADDDAFDPDSNTDVRQRALRAIRVRRGQPAFRAALLHVYAGRCAITGCAVRDVLEAAHIVPYQGSITNHVTNGLLLRADLHTLFDCDLIAIHPDNRRVVISPSLEGSSYAKLAGRALRAPNDDAASPSRKALLRRFAEFEVQQNRQG